MEWLRILLAYFLDLILGDPKWLPHPVKMMGDLINFLETNLRTGSRGKLRIKGTILALVVIVVSGLSVYWILVLAGKINPIVENIIWVLLASTTLATKDLFLHAREIVKEINKGNMLRARKCLSYIVGRDTQNLKEKDIIGATIESISESTNDGIIAPLFYLIIGGPVLAVCYKAINTLDSMVGYRNRKYKEFGWFSAKLDSVANFLPARITGILISCSAFVLGKGSFYSFKIMLRDGQKHPSLNSGVPEAAMAGALGVKLGGPSTYEGKLIHKPYLGETTTPISALLINEALRISFITSFIIVLMGVGFKCVL